MPKSKTLEEYDAKINNLRKIYDEKGLDLDTLKRSFTEYLIAYNYLKRNKKRVVPKPDDHPHILKRDRSVHQNHENHNYYDVFSKLVRRRDRLKTTTWNCQR